MNKTLRYAGFALAGLVVLAVAVIVLARFLISSEQVRQVVLPKAKQALQRDVALGDIDISLFSGIVLHDLTVMGKDGKTPFVTAESVILRYRFWPLFRLKVVVDEVRLDRPRVRVVRLADGTFNFSDLLQKEPKEAKAAPVAGDTKAGRALDLTVSQVQLTGGQVHFSDIRQNPEKPFTLDLSQVNLRAEDIALNKPFSFEAGLLINAAKLSVKGQIDLAEQGGKATVQLTDLNLPDFAPYYQKPGSGGLASLKIGCDLELEGTPQQLHSAGTVSFKDLKLVAADQPKNQQSGPDMSFAYEVRLDRAASTAELKRGRLLVGDWPIDVQGRFSGLDAAPFFEGSVILQRLDLARSASNLPAALAGSLAALKPAGAVQAQLQLAGPLDQPKTLLKTGQVRLDKVAVSTGALRPQLTGDLTLAGDAVTGRDLSLLLGKDTARLDLSVRNLLGKPIRINSELRAEKLQLDALLGTSSPSESAAEPGDHAASGEPAKQLGPYDLPVDAEGSMQVGQAVWRGLTIENLVARYALKNNIFTLEQFSGKTAGGTFSETARVDLGQPGLAYKTHIKTSAIQIDPVITALAPKGAGTLFGLLNLDAELQGQGTGLKDLQRSLTGSGALSVADGKVTGAGLVDRFAEFFDLEELRVLKFSNAGGNLVIKDGRIQLDGKLSGNTVRLAPTGSVGLDGSLDVGLPVQLAPSLTAHLDTSGKFSRFLTDSQGWGMLPLEISGTVKSPSYALDTEALTKTLRQGVQQQLQKTLQEKLFKPKETPSADTPSKDSAQEQRSEDQLLEGVVKGLFGK